MNFGALKNKKGSALLWCVLLTVIVTILLGAIIASVTAYYNYTMYTIKRQQAYFTARSAMDAIINQVSNQTEGDVNYLALPDTKSKGVLKLTEFGFFTKDGEGSEEIKDMGKIKEASITGEYKDHTDQYIIKVKSEYAGQEYTMSSVIAKTPIYFSGIAIKNLTYNPMKTIVKTDGTGSVSNNGTFKLGKKTDLYWNNTDNFYSSMQGENGKLTFELYGNLVTKGDAYIYSGATIAGKQFVKNAKFTKTGTMSKYIWNAEQYLLSNTTLTVVEDSESTDYNETTYKNFTTFFDTKREYCNNNKSTAAMAPGGKFGGPYTVADQIREAVEDSIDSMLDSKTISSSIGSRLADAISSITDEVENLISDYSFDSNALTNTSNDGLSINYIRFLSISNALLSNSQAIRDNWLVGGFNNVVSWFIELITREDFDLLNYIGGIIDDLGYTVMDISYVGYDSTKSGNWSDNVVPVVYMVVDNGLTVRVQTGSQPGRQSISGKLIDRTEDLTDRLISTAFGKNNAAYVIVYLDSAEEGKTDQTTTIELGCPVDRPSIVDEGDLVFNYSIYGGPNSKVILNDGVTVLGEIVCDELEIRGDVNLVYTNSNGSQVAKQRVDEFWSVINYTDSDKD